MFTVTNDAKAKTINENTKYVAIAPLLETVINMSKDKAPYTVLTVGATIEEVEMFASADWMMAHSIVDGWWTIVTIDEITINN